MNSFLRPLYSLTLLFLMIVRSATAANLSDEIRKTPHDVAYVVSSPLRLSSYNWVVLPAAGALAVTMAYDGPIRDRLIHLREWSGQKSLRQAGNVLQLSGITLGVGLMSYGKVRDDDSAFDKGWVQLEGGATAASVGILMKWMIGRGRPGRDDPDQFSAFSSNASFPSGHTLMAFTAAEITSQQYPSWWVRVPSYLIATSVGVSRVASDQHWAGDVLASALLGTIIGHAIVKAHDKPESDWHLVATGNGAQVQYDF